MMSSDRVSSLLRSACLGRSPGLAFLGEDLYRGHAQDPRGEALQLGLRPRQELLPQG